MSLQPAIIDLQDPPPNHNYKASIEQQETTADRNVRLFKEVMFFFVAVGGNCSPPSSTFNYLKRLSEAETQGGISVSRLKVFFFFSSEKKSLLS